MDTIQTTNQLEVELMKKINVALAYIQKNYDKRVYGPWETLQQFKDQCEISYESEGWLEMKMEGKYGWAWFQIDQNDMTFKGVEYTYTPESEMYYSEDDMEEFLAEAASELENQED